LERITTNRENAILHKAGLKTLPPVKLALATAWVNRGCNELVFCRVPLPFYTTLQYP
jgi:hypothetical protein